jgi:hypothetical protein
LGSAALIVVVAALLATNTFGLGGSTNPKVPAGWDSIGYRDAQVSFPPSFATVTSQPGGFGSVMLDESDDPSGGACLGFFGGTKVCLLPLRQAPSTYANYKRTTLNGVPVYLGPKGDYYAPSLHVEVTASGPIAHRIVDTLTRNRIRGCTHAISCGSVTVTVG